MISIIFLSHLSLTAADKTKSISIFKNGTAFFEKETTVNASSGSVILEKLPFERDDNLKMIMFGTIWLYPHNNEFNSVSSYNEKITKEFDAGSLTGILKANIGKKIKILMYKSYKETPIEGKIVKVHGDVVYLDGAGAWQTFNINSIATIEFPDTPNLMYKDSIEKKVLALDFKKKNSSQKLDIMYMQKGLTWLPNYNIELRDGKKARIKLRANLLNDIEDIENADVNFVVGVPSFMYSSQESPLTSNQKVNEFLYSLPGTSGSYRSAGIMSQSILSNRMYDAEEMIVDEDAFMEYQPEGASNEDLFLYSFKNLNLKKGGRGFFDLLATEVDYEDLYSVQLQPVNQYNFNAIQAEQKNEVWHSIRFTNNTKIPLTTGTAFITKKDKGSNTPISQNKLNYTPVSAKSVVKLTVSPDISVSDSEKELERVKKEKQFDSYWHDLITMEGSIKVVNYKKEEVKLKINRVIDGELVESSEDWESKSLLKTSEVKNKKNDTTWEVELSPGESMKIVYTYKIYVRN